jgi:hypothetical protein
MLNVLGIPTGRTWQYNVQCDVTTAEFVIRNPGRVDIVQQLRGACKLVNFGSLTCRYGPLQTQL